MENIKWKEIPTFDGKYLISENGDIKCTKRNIIIKPHFSGVKRRNYHQVTLYRGSEKLTKRVHSWMAITFFNHKYGNRKIVIDHIDNNPLNNHLSNLNVVTMKENNTKDRKKIITD